MPISQKKLDANRRNSAIARARSAETWHKIRERNQAVHVQSFVCEHCCVSFCKAVTALDIKKKRFPRFCSSACAHARKKPPELRERLSLKLRHKKVENGKLVPAHIRYCKNCNSPIHSKSHKRSYCSDACRIEYRSLHKNLKYTESYKNYRCACAFMFNLADYPEEFDFTLIRTYGWYDPQKNSNGVSRDHLYSVSAGFKNKVPSSLLAHPANCKLVLHVDNQSKGGRCAISLDELKARIAAWTAKYGPYSPNTWARPTKHSAVV